MATTNVVAVKVGTGWTIDVTACNLDTDLTIKDFYVLIAGSVSANANFTKTSATVLTYVGVSIASSTVEVRRLTPTAPVQTITFAQRISSVDYNKELDRISRRAEEYALNGIGPGSVITVATPVDTAFGVSWDGNVLQPPTLNAVYDKFVLMAPLASPTFTGSPVAPTPATADNTTQLATTAYVKANLTSYAPLASPTFTGTPVIPTGATGVTQTKNTNNTTLATTAYVNTSNRPAVEAYRSGTVQAIAHNLFTTVIFNTETIDTDAAYNTATGEFTVPAGMGGQYLVHASTVYTSPNTVVAIGAFVGGAEAKRMTDVRVSTDNLFIASGMAVLTLAAGNVVTVKAFHNNTAVASRNLNFDATLSYLSIYRLNA